MKTPIIIAGYGAIGKTYLGKKYKNIVDLEASKYRYFIDNLTEDEIEKYKGTFAKYRTPNPDWPNNYFKAINSSLKHYDVILTSLHEEVLQFLAQNYPDYFIAFPTKKAMKQIIQRSKARGNSKDYIKSVKKYKRQWYKFLKNFPQNRIIWIEPNKYLENYLIDMNIIKV